MAKSKNERLFGEAIQGFVNFWESANENTTETEFEQAMEQ